MSADRIAVTAPDLQVGSDEVVTGQWRVEAGDFVLRGDALIELVTPGLTVSVSAPTDGVLAEICRAAESVVRPHDLLAWIQAAEAEAEDEQSDPSTPAD